jgi:hypothetical protein
MTFLRRPRKDLGAGLGCNGGEIAAVGTPVNPPRIAA